MPNQVSTPTHEVIESPRLSRFIEPSTPPADPVVEALVNQAIAAQRQIEGGTD
jgi:hypothetical protein